MSRPKPPPPGVSSIDESGGRTQVADVPAAKVRGRRRLPGEEVLQNPEAGKKIVESSGPPGTRSIKRDIVEMPMPGMKVPKRHTATFHSADGREYIFRTHDQKGRAVPMRETMCLFLALREQRIGGDPFVVFDAFKLNIKDFNEQQFYPVPGIQVSYSPEPSEEGAGLPAGFSLADGETE